MTAPAGPFAPLHGARAIEVGGGLGVAVAGFLLAELGATVHRLVPDDDLGDGRPAVSSILDRDVRPVSPSIAGTSTYDVVLCGPDLPASIDAPVRVTVPDPPAEGSDRLSPAETMLAEATSGIMWLQLGHRRGPFCLASPVAGLGTGVVGALSATCGLLRHLRRSELQWHSTVDHVDGALALQTLSASFLEEPTDGGPPDGASRYHDPYCVSFSPVMRFFQASDGWVFIGAVSRHMWHTLFELAGHPELNDDPDLDRALPFNLGQRRGDAIAAVVAAYVAGQPVDKLVEHLVARKVVAAPVLSPAQFLRHSQAEANGLVIRSTEAGAPQLQVGGFLQGRAAPSLPFSPPGPDRARALGPLDNAGKGPLDGVRVLDVSRAAAGPICGRVLADLGADVVRVEHPAGETSRRVGLTFAASNRQKRSLGADVKADGGPALLEALSTACDVVLTNALPDASRRMGIDYESVASRNPGACHISVLGFGRNPPFGGRRVVDAAAQALSGQALAEGGGGEPVGCTGGLLDNGTGWLAALGTVALLYQRQATGRAGAVEASLLSTSAFVQLLRLADPPLLTGHSLGPERLGYAPDQRLYEAVDGWVCIAAIDAEQHRAFARLLSRWGLTDPTPGHGTAIGPLGRLVEEEVRGRTVQEVLGECAAVGLGAVTPVRTLEAFARSDHERFCPVAQEGWGTLLQPRPLPAFDGRPRPSVAGVALCPGRDNEAVLDDYGVDEGRRMAWRASGVLPTEPRPAPLVASAV